MLKGFLLIGLFATVFCASLDVSDPILQEYISAPSERPKEFLKLNTLIKPEPSPKKCENSAIILRTLELIITIMNQNMERQAHTTYILNLLMRIIQKNTDKFSVREQEVMDKMLDALENNQGPTLSLSNSELRNKSPFSNKGLIKVQRSYCADALLKISQIATDAYNKLTNEPVDKLDFDEFRQKTPEIIHVYDSEIISPCSLTDNKQIPGIFNQKPCKVEATPKPIPIKYKNRVRPSLTLIEYPLVNQNVDSSTKMQNTLAYKNKRTIEELRSLPWSSDNNYESFTSSPRQISEFTKNDKDIIFDENAQHSQPKPEAIVTHYKYPSENDSPKIEIISNNHETTTKVNLITKEVKASNSDQLENDKEIETTTIFTVNNENSDFVAIDDIPNKFENFAFNQINESTNSGLDPNKNHITTENNVIYANIITEVPIDILDPKSISDDYYNPTNQDIMYLTKHNNIMNQNFGEAILNAAEPEVHPKKIDSQIIVDNGWDPKINHHLKPENNIMINSNTNPSSGGYISIDDLKRLNAEKLFTYDASMWNMGLDLPDVYNTWDTPENNEDSYESYDSIIKVIPKKIPILVKPNRGPYKIYRDLLLNQLLSHKKYNIRNYINDNISSNNVNAQTAKRTQPLLYQRIHPNAKHYDGNFWNRSGHPTHKLIFIENIDNSPLLNNRVSDYENIKIATARPYTDKDFWEKEIHSTTERVFIDFDTHNRPLIKDISDLNNNENSIELNIDGATKRPIHTGLTLDPNPEPLNLSKKRPYLIDELVYKLPNLYLPHDYSSSASLIFDDNIKYHLSPESQANDEIWDKSEIRPFVDTNYAPYLDQDQSPWNIEIAAPTEPITIGGYDQELSPIQPWISVNPWSYGINHTPTKRPDTTEEFNPGPYWPYQKHWHSKIEGSDNSNILNVDNSASHPYHSWIYNSNPWDNGIHQTPTKPLIVKNDFHDISGHYWPDQNPWNGKIEGTDNNLSPNVDKSALSPGHPWIINPYPWATLNSEIDASSISGPIINQHADTFVNPYFNPWDSNIESTTIESILAHDEPALYPGLPWGYNSNQVNHKILLTHNNQHFTNGNAFHHILEQHRPEQISWDDKIDKPDINYLQNTYELESNPTITNPIPWAPSSSHPLIYNPKPWHYKNLQFEINTVPAFILNQHSGKFLNPHLNPLEFKLEPSLIPPPLDDKSSLVKPGYSWLYHPNQWVYKNPPSIEKEVTIPSLILNQYPESYWTPNLNPQESNPQGLWNYVNHDHGVIPNKQPVLIDEFVQQSPGYYIPDENLWHDKIDNTNINYFPILDESEINPDYAWINNPNPWTPSGIDTEATTVPVPIINQYPGNYENPYLDAGIVSVEAANIVDHDEPALHENQPWPYNFNPWDYGIHHAPTNRPIEIVNNFHQFPVYNWPDHKLWNSKLDETEINNFQNVDKSELYTDQPLIYDRNPWSHQLFNIDMEKTDPGSITNQHPDNYWSLYQNTWDIEPPTENIGTKDAFNHQASHRLWFYVNPWCQEINHTLNNPFENCFHQIPGHYLPIQNQWNSETDEFKNNQFSNVKESASISDYSIYNPYISGNNSEITNAGTFVIRPIINPQPISYWNPYQNPWNSEMETTTTDNFVDHDNLILYHPWYNKVVPSNIIAKYPSYYETPNLNVYQQIEPATENNMELSNDSDLNLNQPSSYVFRPWDHISHGLSNKKPIVFINDISNYSSDHYWNNNDYKWDQDVHISAKIPETFNDLVDYNSNQLWDHDLEQWDLEINGPTMQLDFVNPVKPNAYTVTNNEGVNIVPGYYENYHHDHSIWHFESTTKRYDTNNEHVTLELTNKNTNNNWINPITILGQKYDGIWPHKNMLIEVESETEKELDLTTTNNNPVLTEFNYFPWGHDVNTPTEKPIDYENENKYPNADIQINEILLPIQNNVHESTSPLPDIIINENSNYNYDIDKDITVNDGSYTVIGIDNQIKPVTEAIKATSPDLTTLTEDEDSTYPMPLNPNNSADLAENSSDDSNLSNPVHEELDSTTTTSPVDAYQDLVTSNDSSLIPSYSLSNNGELILTDPIEIPINEQSSSGETKNPESFDLDIEDKWETETQVLDLIQQKLKVLEQQAKIMSEYKILKIILKIKRIISEAYSSKDKYLQVLTYYDEINNLLKVNGNKSKLNFISHLYNLVAEHNLMKLDGQHHTVEMTYLVRRLTPIVIYPYYFVKYKVPVNKINELVKENPDSIDDNGSLHEELLGTSDISDISSALQNISDQELLKLIIEHGEVVDTKLVTNEAKVKSKHYVNLGDNNIFLYKRDNTTNNAEIGTTLINTSKLNENNSPTNVNKRKKQQHTTLKENKHFPIEENIEIDHLNDLSDPFRKMDPMEKLRKATEEASARKQNLNEIVHPKNNIKPLGNLITNRDSYKAVTELASLRLPPLIQRNKRQIISM